MATWTTTSNPNWGTWVFTGYGSGGGGTTTYPVVVPLGQEPLVALKQVKTHQGNVEGYECISCSYFSPMAELNIPEGTSDCISFQCYGCRFGLRSLFTRDSREEIII